MDLLIQSVFGERDYISSGVNKDWMKFIKAKTVEAIVDAVSREKPSILMSGEIPKIEGVGQVDTREYPIVIDYRVPVYTLSAPIPKNPWVSSSTFSIMWKPSGLGT